MTTLRQAAQQALEALGKINTLSVGENAICLPAEIDGAMDALRAALAEPEPRNQCGETCQRAKLCAVCARGLAEPAQEPTSEAIHAAWSAGFVEGEKAALAEPVQEPVRRMIRCKYMRENNGVCPLHNLQCGWPKCNG